MKQFQESLIQFVHPCSEADQSNLYAELTNLAEGLKTIEFKLDRILKSFSQEGKPYGKDLWWSDDGKEEMMIVP